MNGFAVPGWLTTVLFVGMLLSVAYASLTTSTFVKQVGPANKGDRYKLAAEMDAWARDRRDAVVRWLDYPALSKLDIAELLHERGWFYAGQERHAPGWPLFVTRDRRRAVCTDPPPNRTALLHAELREATRSGRGVHRLDLTPYSSLDRTAVAAVAKEEGWSVTTRHITTMPLLDLVRPGFSDVDQWAGEDDPRATEVAAEPGSDDERHPMSGVPRGVQRKINGAAALGVVVLVLVVVALAAHAAPSAVHVLLAIAAVVAVPFAILVRRAGRAYGAYKFDEDVRREMRRLPP